MQEGVINKKGNLTEKGLKALEIIKDEEQKNPEEQTIGYRYGIDPSDKRDIELLDFSIRLFRLLKSRQITTVNQLAKKTIVELKEMGVNTYGLKELKVEFSK